jgi:hypothetical protein
VLEIVPDQGIEIYWWNNDDWVAIKNRRDYLSAVHRIYPKIPDNLGGGVYWAVFDIPQAREPINVCIILKGIKIRTENRKMLRHKSNQNCIHNKGNGIGHLRDSAKHQLIIFRARSVREGDKRAKTNLRATT